MFTRSALKRSSEQQEEGSGGQRSRGQREWPRRGTENEPVTEMDTVEYGS